MEKTSVDFEKYLNFHKEFGGTGKLYKFKFLEYKKGFLKLEGEFSAMTLNPNQSVQGGQMNSMLDDVTSLLVIYVSKGDYYPSSTNLHSIHHRPLFAGKVIATAEVIKVGKKIAKQGRDKYMKYFNSDLVADFILSKTLNFKSKRKFIWEI